MPPRLSVRASASSLIRGRPLGLRLTAESSSNQLSLTADEGDKDLFVHQSDIDREGFRSLDEGMKVTYEEETGDKGPKAVSVKPLI